MKSNQTNQMNSMNQENQMKRRTTAIDHCDNYLNPPMKFFRGEKLLASLELAS